MGHALFFGVGGYTSGMLNFHLGVPPVLSILVGVIMAAVAGLIIGVPALRTRGPYFSLITLIAPIVLLRAFVFFSDITGGETGLVGVEKITFATLPNYYIAFGVFLFALGVFLAVTRSDAGRVFTAIREDEDAVGAAGLNPAKFKVFAFVLSGAVGGLAGAVLVHSNVGSVSPNQILSLVISIEVIIAAIFGGMGTITGAAIGGFFFFLLRDWLRGVETVIPVIGVTVSELDLLIFGVVILGFIFFMPEGVLRRMIIWSHRIRGGTDAEDTEPVSDGGRTPLRATAEKFVRELHLILRGDDNDR
ncbi:MAG: branched-chain amino acid ABC transporter permease [Halobacteria archaeon]|nr:branched-chain amino acid ABC transporter permease [Halobacteria archaeon]